MRRAGRVSCAEPRAKGLSLKFCIPTSFMNPKHFVGMAEAADAAGFWAVAVSDHVVHPARIESAYPYAEDGKAYWDSSNPWPDPWITIAAMAAVTSRLRFFTNVFVLPARHPVHVAKAVSTAAVLSDDRVALGIGVGWMREEFEVLDENFSTRGKRTNEAIEILRKLWAGGMTEHHGEFYDFAPVEMSPSPGGQVPIYCGGLSAPALRRAARLCDGWIAVVHSTDELRGFIARLGELRREYGRANEPFEIVAAATDAFDIDGFRRLEDAGVSAMMMLPWLLHGADPNSLEEKCDSIRRFGDEVIAKMA